MIDKNTVYYTQPNSPCVFTDLPKESDWKCYMFGNTPDGYGMVYTPSVGNVPNFFIRWMMKICLGCTWVKK